jgi:hypothetical protein
LLTQHITIEGITGRINFRYVSLANQYSTAVRVRLSRYGRETLTVLFLLSVVICRALMRQTERQGRGIRHSL